MEGIEGKAKKTRRNGWICYMGVVDHAHRC